jgi:hypothetical protein
MALLSGLGSLLAQRGAQAIAAGLVGGVVGGAGLMASGLVPVGGTRAAATVALLACPGSGNVLVQTSDGETLLVTARSADGRWLQVDLGQPGVDRAWAPASAVRMESAVETLPVADCAAPTDVPSASAGPTATAVVITPTPGPTLTAGPTALPTPTSSPTRSATPKPTAKPTPKPTPIATPDTTPPSITNITVSDAYVDPSSGQHVINAQGNGCGTPYQATISASITDPSGLAGGTVNLFFYEPNTLNVHTQPMAFNLNDHLWRSTITAQGGWQPYEIVYWIRAQDRAGNLSDYVYPNSSYLLYMGQCIL